MAKNRQMRYLLIIVFSIFCITAGVAQQFKVDKTPQLASQYFNGGQYAKAAELYRQLYTKTNISTYFNSYITSLIRSENFKDAEKEVKRYMRKHPSQIHYYITLGQIFKAQKDNKKTEQYYNEALQKLKGDQGTTSTLVNTFINSQEFVWAQKALDIGKRKTSEVVFYYDQGRLYRIMRNYDKMADVFLKWLKTDKTRLSIIQSYFNSAMADLSGDETAKLLQEKVQNAANSDPSYLPYKRLQIWIYINRKQFEKAYDALTSLNAETNKESSQIFTLARSARQIKQFDIARKAYQYLIATGKTTSYYRASWLQMIDMEFERIESMSAPTSEVVQPFIEMADKAIENLKINHQTYKVAIQRAHVLAFYLHQTEEAIKSLEELMKVRQLNTVMRAEAKIEMADIYSINSDPWQATLYYSQAIDLSRNHPMADQAKWKKARLGFLIGDFAWAKAQLDAIKGSTSKLTSNDAIDLAMLIGANSNLDTTDVALKNFARIEYYIFKRQEVPALQSIDTLLTNFTDHSLADEALYRKAQILIRQHKYTDAVTALKRISDQYSSGILADDAMFMIGKLYEDQLKQPAEAKTWFRNLILRYPSSAYANEARKKYQDLNTTPNS
jgi:TolA-binding protein/Flp pilus assembly protein TadD